MQREVPLREVAIAQQAERVGVAAGIGVDDLAAEVAVADQPRAADALQAVAGRDVGGRQPLVAEQPQRQIVGLELPARLREIEARVEGAAQRAVEIDRLRREAPADRPAGAAPASADPRRRRRSGASARAPRCGPAASPCASSCSRDATSASACTMSIGASVPTSTRMRLSSSSLRASSSDRRRHLQLVDGVDVVPVGVADVGQRVGDGRPQLQLADVAVDPGDAQLRARRVGAEVAQQRLDEQRRERRVELRVERVEAAGRILAAVVEADREVAAAPRQQLRAAEVERRLIVLDGLRADQLIGRELGDVVLADGRRQESGGSSARTPAICRSKVCGFSRSTAISRLCSSASATASSSVRSRAPAAARRLAVGARRGSAGGGACAR